MKYAMAVLISLLAAMAGADEGHLRVPEHRLRQLKSSVLITKGDNGFPIPEFPVSLDPAVTFGAQE
jgi:hypothetical protein